MQHRTLTLLLIWLAAGPAWAQAQVTPAPGPGSTGATHARSIPHPLWRELSAEQREALAPLAADWDSKFDANRKKKWLEIAAKYPNMSPEGKQRMHQRMPQLAKLTPEQRETTRENFVRAYSLPPDQRQALTQRYQELPEERKRALAAQAHAKKPAVPPRRPAARAHETGSAQPAPASR